jgi:hypothetical protein
MPLNARLPLLPVDAIEIGDSLAIHTDDERIVFFNAAGPIFSCRRGDRTGLRLGAVTAVAHGWAKPTAVAKALGVHRTTVFRDGRKFAQDGVEGLVVKRRGPKRPHALTSTVRRRAQKLIDGGESIRAAAASVGVSERGLRHGIRRGLLVARAAGSGKAGETVGTTPMVGVAARAASDQSCRLGVATHRETERLLACTGELVEAQPQFKSVEGVAGAGVLLALPALLHEGLLEVGTAVYGKLSNGFFGLRSVLLTFAFMALLRIRTPEQLTERAPGEMGAFLGLDRAPEVKTLRRKLRELAQRGLADTFSRQLTERWAQATPRELALLYVDGHVRPYLGRAHQLPRHHVQQRGRPMPGTKDFHVNDRRSDPVLCVTAEGTASLLTTLDGVLLPDIRRLVGPRRRVTVAFDREGWSPPLFAKWKAEAFDVLTYRKGKQSQWRNSSFDTVGGRVGGQKVEYRLAERKVGLSNGLRVREIRRLSDDGHQTAVITTNERLPMLAVAHRMFSRWRQENFFRYMRHEFALDHLCTYAVEAADPNRLVANPERTRLEKRRAVARAARTRLIDRRLDLAPGQTVRLGARRLDEEELDRLIDSRDSEIHRLGVQIAKLPRRIPIKDVLAPDQIVRLERERKVLVDTIKHTAYRAETALARLVEPIFSRHEEEARKLLKSIFRATADIIPCHSDHRLTVRFHGLANPRATRALSDLCAIANQDATLYPGTDLFLHFQVLTLQE